MSKQKLTLLLGSLITIIIIAGYFSTTWNTDISDPTTSNSPSASPTGDNATNTPNESDSNPNSQTTSDTDETSSPNPTEQETASNNSASNPGSSPTSNTNSQTTPNTDYSSNTFSDYASYTSTSSASTITVAEASASNKADHEDMQDYTWSSSEIIEIALNKNSVNVENGVGVAVEGTKVIIQSAGTYRISGTLDDGQIIISASDQAVVRLILGNVKISSIANAPIYVASAHKVIIVLDSNTENSITDNASNQDDAAIYSKTDLTICGDGSLSVSGNANDGIRSSDGLIIKSGNIQVTSVDDGICGKDYIVIEGGYITVNSTGDGLKSDNEENSDRGYILIEDGTLIINSKQGDAVSAETDLLIANGTITITSGNGSNSMPNNNVSTKGLKGKANVVIDNGSFTIDSSDDAIHSNGTIVINNGKYYIATGDDAVHADTYLEINGGTFEISQCFEGMESAAVTINNGYIQISSSDDGLNAAGGNDGSSTDFRPGLPGQFGGPGQGGFPSSGNYSLKITGGFIYIDAYGDGVDINGYIEMSGGILIINGPLVDFDGAIDYDSTFKVTGGTIIAVGSSGMAMAPSASSTQYSILVRLASPQQANTLINIQTASGETILTFSPTKTYQSIAYCSPELTTGSYNLYLGGSSTGTPAYGVYKNGIYNQGNKYASFNISGIVTNIR